ncbi:hypothetical protein N9112_00785 [bacterium]|nr:hypothetical protein [bacterium]|tara:strand:- start:37 stop:807 length:771 start_codon:yes stop_codon:yes gene_type:complete
MPFSLKDFNSKLAKHGVAKNNLFAIRITNLPPALLTDQIVNPIATDLEFFCRSITLPEMDITTTDIQHQGFGATSRRPQSLTFPVMPAVFMVDSDFGVMKLFHRWVQSIINFDTEGGILSGNNNQLPYEMAYKDEYSTTMEVAVYSFNSESVEYVYKFSGLYPVQVGSVNPAWENAGEVLTLPVGFTYDEVTVTGTKTGIVLGERSGSFSGGLLSWFSTINTVAQSIKNVRKPRDVQDAINQVNSVNTILDNFKKF